MAILWPRASSQKVRSSTSAQLLWRRITIGWEDTRRGVPELDETPVSFHRPHNGTRAGKSKLRPQLLNLGLGSRASLVSWGPEDPVLSSRAPVTIQNIPEHF